MSSMSFTWSAQCQRKECASAMSIHEMFYVVRDDEDTVVGWLTADDVIERLEHG